LDQTTVTLSVADSDPGLTDEGQMRADPGSRADRQTFAALRGSPGARA
jgi:hypothetical protein